MATDRWHVSKTVLGHVVYIFKAVERDRSKKEADLTSTNLSRRERRNGQSEARWARDRQIKKGRP